MNFQDKLKRDWEISLDAPKAREIKRLGLDLVDIKSDPIAKLSMNPLLLADALWIFCKTQAMAQNLTQVDLESGLDGEANSRAIQAIAEATVDFFPDGQRSLIRSLQAQNAAVQEKAEAEAIRKMSDPAEMAKIAATMNRMSAKAMDRILRDLETTEPSSLAGS